MSTFLPLDGRVAVVTGGSSGIGAASARRLAAAGASVVVGYNTGGDRAQALVRELPDTGRHRAAAIQIEDSAALRRLAGELADAYGRCDVLVNSAGFTRPVPHRDLEELDD